MKDKRAIIVVSGGVAHCSYLPKGMEVEIRDYDVEGSDNPHIEFDDDGDRFVKMEFAN